MAICRVAGLPSAVLDLDWLRGDLLLAATVQNLWRLDTFTEKPPLALKIGLEYLRDDDRDDRNQRTGFD